MAEQAHAYSDSVARLGRAVAVTLLAATQRPSQDAMGKGAVRSQMDTRICLRVRERRDVDLILGQGAFKLAGTLTSSPSRVHSWFPIPSTACRKGTAPT
jgi:DNA segregation ATPase FtsK/SpoIIIE-like protein